MLSIVIPAYNEARNVGKGSLTRAVEYLGGLGCPYELIVVDDGSEDETVELVSEIAKTHPSIRLIRQEHRGKAYAVAGGVSAATGRYVLFMDMDLSTALEHLSDAVRELDAGADIVIGSREAPGAVRIGAPFARRWLGKSFNLLVQLLLLPGLDDTQCGFKAFRAEVARELFGSLVVFGQPNREVRGPRVTAFDVELLVAARKRGNKIAQIPVTWRHVDTRRVRPAADAYRMLREVLSVWLNKVRGRYNLDHRSP